MSGLRSTKSKSPFLGKTLGYFFDFIKTFCNLYIPMSGGEQVIVFKSSMYVALLKLSIQQFLLDSNRILFELGLV